MSSSVNGVGMNGVNTINSIGVNNGSHNLGLTSMNVSSSSRGYQPLCFSKEVFTRDTFLVDGFITDCRRRVPLESVLSDLKEYMVSLDNELLELINKDYTDFVNLSSNLVGIDKVLNELRFPLQTIKEEVSALRNALVKSLENVENKLNEKRELSFKKNCLVLLLNVSQSIQKIEKLLKIDEAHLGKTSVASVLLNEDEETSNLIERVASEFNQLKFFVSRGKAFPFVTNMEPKILYIENSLEKGLEHLFKDGLAKQNRNIISNCLRTYAAIDKIREAHLLYASFVVNPVAQQLVVADKVETASGLLEMYQSIINFISTECSLLLSLTQQSIRGYDFLTNSLWAQFGLVIMQNCPKIFSPAFPDAFHSSYGLSMDFLSKVESFCRTKNDLNNLRSHPVYTDFMKRWNLTIYFQLRFQEIASLLENSLRTTTRIDTDNNSEFSIGCTNVLWHCLQQCWSKNIYLASLGHKFFRLSLQLIARYKNWIQNGIESFINKSELIEPWNNVTLKDWVVIHHDISSITQKIRNGYISLVKNTLGVTAQLDSVIDSSYLECLSWFDKILDSLGNIICSSVSESCVEGLQPLRGIAATYRMTNKSVPSKPSLYLPNVLNPLSQFLNQFSRFVSGTSSMWIRAVLKIVSEKYLEMINELLDSVHKSEAMLKKMVKKSHANNSGAMSDIEKIHLQLYLDVEEFGSQIEKLGVNPNELESFHLLIAAVATGKKLKQELGGQIQE